MLDGLEDAYDIAPDGLRRAGRARQFRRRRQLAVNQQVADFQEVAVLGQRFDRITAIPQDTRLAVQKCDRAARRTRVDVAFVERDQAGFSPQFGDVDGVLALGTHMDRQIDLPVTERQLGNLGHRRIPFEGGAGTAEVVRQRAGGRETGPNGP